MNQPRSPFLFRVFNCFHPLVLVLACALLPECSFGQGGIIFATRTTGVNAPVTNIVTGLPLSGAAWLAQLYYGPPGNPEIAMVTFTNPAAHFGTGLNAGYITVGSGGGNRYVEPAIVSPGGGTAFQIRVWSAVLGTSWEAAYPNWLSGSFGCDAGMGRSSVIVTRTSANTLEPPQPLLGMQGFIVWSCPEPGVGVLASLALAVFFCRGWFARMWRH